MARPVLRLRLEHRIFAIVAAGALFLPAALHSATCPPDLSTTASAAAAPAARQQQVRDLQKALLTSPFYKELVRRDGKPLACGVTLDDTIVKLTYSFRNKATLESTVTAGAESAEQRMQVRSITANAATALLKIAEKSSFNGGCGIVWGKPAEEAAGDQPGTRELVYRGDTCNCQARLVYKGKSVIGLILRSAC